MRLLYSLLALTIVLAGAAPIYADSTGDLTFTLDSYVGSGTPTNRAPDADSCLQPNCVLFTGTLTDNETDLSFMSLYSIDVTFGSGLSVDNTFYEDTSGILSGDPAYATDNLGLPANIYTGPVFGIDIAPGTPFGAYQGTVTITTQGGTDDPGFQGQTFSQLITVNVVPEPATAGLFFACLLSCLVWRGVRHKCRSSEVLQ